MAGGDSDLTVRQAREADYEDVVAFTEDTWPERDGGDYIPRVFHEWVETDGPDQRTFVAEAGGDVAGICQCVLLGDHEAWAQGMRVHPDVRGHGVSSRINDAAFSWAADRGATVCRNMVFSWNVAGLGGARAAGFDPVTEFRWAHPDPDADATGPDDRRLVEAPDAAWTAWTGSEARDALAGLALDGGESWALSDLTREDLHRAADDARVFAVTRGSGKDGRATGMTFRVRDYEREEDGDAERWVEYGVGAYEDVATARALFAAIARDAAALGADRTRVLLPETARHVTDAAYARADLAEDPDFVLAADLTTW